MIRRLAILAFIALTGVASAQYSDVRIHASRSTKQGPEVWLAESLPESLYNNAQVWLPIPKAYTSTQYSFAVYQKTNDFLIGGAVFTNAFSGGMYFDGIDDYLYSPTPDLLGIYTNRGHTLMAWVKTFSVPAGSTVYTLAGFDLSGNINQFIWYQGQVGYYSMVGGDVRWLKIDALDHASKPTFVVFAHDVGLLRNIIYTNGIFAGSTNLTGFANCGGGTVWGTLFGIRQKGPSLDQPFKGWIYEVVIMTNKCVTSNEQFNYYNQTRSRYGL